MKVVALIPMRAGSKRIPKKHFFNIAGFSPALRAACAALGAPSIDEVWIATNDGMIRDQLKEKPVKFFERSEENASAMAKTEAVIVEFLAAVDCDLVVLIQATNCFTKAHHLKEAIAKMKKENADSVVSGVRMNRYFYSFIGRSLVSTLNKDTQMRVGRKNVHGLFCENGAFYIFKREVFERSGEILGGLTIAYEMPMESLIELDEPSDWELTEAILKGVSAHAIPQ